MNPICWANHPQIRKLITKTNFKPAVASHETGDIQSKGNKPRVSVVSGRTSPADVSIALSESVDRLSQTATGYAKCLKFWSILEDRPFLDVPTQTRHFSRLLSKYPEAQWPKVFKGMLADFFSYQTKQDRPEVLASYKQLFYPRLQRMLEKKQKNSVCRNAAIFWNLMQCKSLAPQVNQDMIKETLIKHRDTLTKCERTDSELLDGFKEFIRPYVKKTVLSLPRECRRVKPASNHSTESIPRSRGGLKLNDTVQFTKHIHPDRPRIEPTTVHIAGPPGNGKSLIQSFIAEELKKLNFSTYTRNSGTEHWDGYENDTCVMIDDFMQHQIHVSAEKEIGEFCTLNSTVDHRLPMAHLSKKGTLFTSPLLLYSSNIHQMGTSASNHAWTSPRAYYRRIDFDLELVKGKNNLYTLTQKTVLETQEPPAGRFEAPIMSSEFVRVELLKTTSLKYVARTILSLMLNKWEEKSKFYQEFFEPRIHHIVADSGTETYGYSYPLDPEALDTVRCHAIPEPLKVRVITIGSKLLFALKPLQQAMFKSLGDYPCFKPCFTPDYLDLLDSIHSNSTCDPWLSGDYSSATDGLHMDVMYAFRDILLEELGEHPLTPYIKADCGSHLLQYPKHFNIPDAEQTNGQLMGSLLSFPVLCLANAYTACLARQESLSDLKCAIHGDDILMKVNRSQYSKWKGVARGLGLELSVGKNYYSKEFGSIDSQLFSADKKGVFQLPTGKYRTLSSENVEQACTVLLKRKISKGLIVNLLDLKKTPRSLDVGVQFGGLDPEGREPQTELEMAINYLRVKGSLMPRVVDKMGENHLVYLPLWLLEQESLRPLHWKVEDMERESPSLWSTLKRLRKMGHRSDHEVDLRESKLCLLPQDQISRLLRQAQAKVASVSLSKEDRDYFAQLKRLNGYGT